MMPEARQLNFPKPVSVADSELESETTYFRVHRTIAHPFDATTEDQMYVIEASGTLDFWDHPEEDAYDEDDDDAL